MKLNRVSESFATVVPIIFAAILSIGSAHADEDIPAYKVLKCETNCPNITPPVPLDKPKPIFPLGYRGEFHVYSEALVDIRYTIGTDGKVSDAKVEQLLGPQAFADRTLAAVEGWQYRPAMEDGKPIAVNSRTRFMFRMQEAEKGARDTVVRDYRSAILLATHGKIGEAISALKQIGAQPELNFYERTTMADGLAMLYVQTDDYENALEQIRIATISEGSYLDSRSRDRALRLRVELEANSGQLAEAFAWFEILKKHASIAADDPTAKLVAQLHASIEASQPLAFDVKVPHSSEATWQHTLLRRTFGFANVQGKLDGFDLRCDAHGIESAVSDKAQWTVPKSWTGCMIYVKGDPGTTFRFLEAHASNS